MLSHFLRRWIGNSGRDFRPDLGLAPHGPLEMVVGDLQVVLERDRLAVADPAAHHVGRAGHRRRGR
jgi:hypothetical protein